MRLLAVACASFFLAGSAAQAASLLINTPIADAGTTLSWDGLYVGVGPGTELWTGPKSTEHKIEIEAYFGGNITSGNLLFGAEAFYTGYYAFEPNATGNKVGITGRIGYLVTPETVVYAEAGGYNDFVFGDEALIGAGVEFMVADHLSIDVAYDYDIWVPNPKFTAHQLSLSANWHF